MTAPNPTALASHIGVITKDDANHVLWFHTRREGYSPGSGIEAVLNAFAAVDEFNRAKLRRAYPTLGAAFEVSIKVGLEPLREIAGAS